MLNWWDMILWQRSLLFLEGLVGLNRRLQWDCAGIWSDTERWTEEAFIQLHYISTAAVKISKADNRLKYKNSQLNKINNTEQDWDASWPIHMQGAAENRIVCNYIVVLHLFSTCYESIMPAFVMLLSYFPSSFMPECSEKPALYSEEVFFYNKAS